jgi:hypothetical protein
MSGGYIPAMSRRGKGITISQPISRSSSALQQSAKGLRTLAPRLVRRRACPSPQPVGHNLLVFLYTCKTSPSRATISYNTGLTKKPINSREINPATVTIAKGFWVSEPMPVERAAGSSCRKRSEYRLFATCSENPRTVLQFNLRPECCAAAPHRR